MCSLLCGLLQAAVDVKHHSCLLWVQRCEGLGDAAACLHQLIFGHVLGEAFRAPAAQVPHSSTEMACKKANSTADWGWLGLAVAQLHADK